MKYSSILNDDLIFCGLEGEDRSSVYCNMLKKMAHEISVPINIDECCVEIMKREDDIRIPYEMGLALPHFRNPIYKDLYTAIAILKKPVLLKPNDKTPCQVILLSLISENTSDIYLKGVSAMARFLMKPGNIDELIQCNTAEKVKGVLDKHDVILKKEITAEDIMERNYPSVNINSPVSDALDIFTRENKIQIPVLDDDKKLVGILDASAIIRKHIPEYIMMMDNLKFLNSFEPFHDLLKKEQDLMVKDFIREPKATTSPMTPIIQFTVKLVKEEARNIFVVDDSGQLLGIVTIQELINKILRG